jgi:hypothetical protein
LAILPADKGSATAVINKDRNSRKMKELLKEPAYKVITQSFDK